MTTGEYLNKLKELTLEFEKEHGTTVVSMTMERENIVTECGIKFFSHPKFIVKMANEK